MNGLPYYKAYPRDFIEGTIGMSFELKGAYRLVLDLIYMQGGNLPDDDRYISGLLGCSIRKWKSLRSELVEAGKLIVSGEFLTNYRAEKELETLAKRQEKQRENGSRPKKNKDLQKPRLNHTEPDTDISSLRSDSAPAAAPEQKPKKIRAHRLPDDWQPDREAAAKVGLPPSRIDLEAAKFRDYWVGQPDEKGRKVDWLATWRNWCRNAVDRLPASERSKIAQPATADPRQIVLSYDTPPADRARYFIETGRWPQLWGDRPGEEFCFLPPNLIQQCLEARRIAA